MGRKKSTDKPSTENGALDQVIPTTAQSRGKSDSKVRNQGNESKNQKTEALNDESADKPEQGPGVADGSLANAKTVPSAEPQGNDRHFRTVELATRLACAQITADSYSRSARLTVSGIQRVAAAFTMASARIKTDLETLHSRPELIDAAFVDRAYADLLRAAEVNELSLDPVLPLNHPEHDGLFEGAMFRAQRLLRPFTEDATLVHAEQLFEAEEVLSELQVGDRFKQSNWPGLKNRNDFYDFILCVEQWFSAYLGRLHSPEEDPRFSEDAEMMEYILDMGYRRRQENDLFRKIYDLVKTHRPPNQMTSTERLSHATWAECLIKVVYCGRRPFATRKDKTRITRRYRPWGVFRFLRIHGADDLNASELLEPLICQRRHLAPDAFVHPFRQNPSTYDFGALDHLVEEREQKEMRELSI